MSLLSHSNGPPGLALLPEGLAAPKISSSHEALKRIRRLVSNRMAMLIPEVVTYAEGKLSNTLRRPGAVLAPCGPGCLLSAPAPGTCPC